MKPQRWKEIEKLYNAALEIDPGRRREYLAQTCAGDESLRKEVERMLDCEQEASMFIEAPAIEMLAQGLAADSALFKGTQSMIGKPLSHYQISRLIGKGGMGEVYQAKDQKLGRDVAIKVLPEEFARDADRVGRIEREAKLLASLNHPNIGAIYGLEESGGINFLVLELVEGETLADRIKTGPVPVEEALKLALQIAEALEAAHDKGIMHRDLKPANIKVTPDGKVKVLDFGLAKAFAGDHGELNLSNSLTLSNDITQLGVIQGTAAYMSPEQARGKTVDKKADIWAFGCVLFEMLTGRAAFSGTDLTDILAAVIRSEPDWSSLPSGSQWRLREMLERCLNKESRNRYHDISDVRVDLQKILADPGGVIHPVSVEPLSKYKRITWIAAVFVLIALLAIPAFRSSKPTPPMEQPQPYCLSFVVPKAHMLGLALTRPRLAVSPDGNKFVYCTPKGIYLRLLGDLQDKLIQGTDSNPEQPFFYPSGESIGFWSERDRKFKKININGTVPVNLFKERAPGYVTCNEDNTIIFSAPEAGIKRISVDAVDGEPELLIKSETDTLFTPRLLPGGKSVIFTIATSTKDDYQIAVQSLQTGTLTKLTRGSDAYYLHQTGHLIYILDKDLVASAFDPETLKISGGPTAIIPAILRTTGVPHFAVSTSGSGTIVYLSETPIESLPKRKLVWVDRNGKEESLGIEPGAYNNPRISPDGRKLVLSVGTLSDFVIKIWDLVDKFMIQKTDEGNIDSLPLWTPNGKRVVFYRQTKANFEVRSIALDNGNKNELPSYHLQRKMILPECWVDEKTLLTTATTVGSGHFTIGILSMEEAPPQWRALSKGNHSEFEPRLSPDGRWMAYTSIESGQNEVWVSQYPEINKGPWRVDNGGGNSPLWSPDGRELFYRNEEDEVMEVPIETSASGFSHGTPKSLFKGHYVRSELSEGNYDRLHTWDISLDGQRFLMMKEDNASASGGPQNINVILNFFEYVRQKASMK